MRRRAEVRLWQERSDAATVRGFIGDQPVKRKGPTCAGARVLLAEGDRDGAARRVREVWRSEELSERTEAEVFETFRDLLTRDDHRARMDKRIGAKDFAGAMRAARRLGSDDVAIVKACAAVTGNADKALELLDDVADRRPAQDLGYTLCRDPLDACAMIAIADATRLMLAAAPETMALQDTDEWWRERRILARKLLDLGEFQTAYQVVRDAAPPANENYRAEFHFMAGWIALRYLNDPATARDAFRPYRRRLGQSDRAGAGQLLARPRRRGAGDNEEMRAGYRSCRALYHRLLRPAGARQARPRQDRAARAAAGRSGRRRRLSDERCTPPTCSMRIGERDLVLSFVTDLAEQSGDAAVLAALGELAGRHNDARAMLQIGKTALARGLALDLYAFPDHRDAAAQPDRSRDRAQHHLFGGAHRERVRPARQVVGQRGRPDAGHAGSRARHRQAVRRQPTTGTGWSPIPSTTRRWAPPNSARCCREYRGSHIMAFAGYNAGRGRVQQWVKQHGDPRDPNVDAVDWVERIPFAETRNYVQRVMENLQVYRVRFDPDAAAVPEIEARHAEPELNSASALPPPTSISER